MCTAEINGKHLYCVNNRNGYYFIDFYFPDYNLAIEIDEHNHIVRDPTYEKCREDYIMNKLRCTLYIYSL